MSVVSLGPLSLEHPFILAPMAGITHSPFRRLMRRHGSSAVVSELVSATGMVYAGAKSLELLKFHEEERPIGLQLFGDNPEHLIKAFQTAETFKPDFIDLNMGCPVPKVVKRGGGSAMTRDPAGLSKLLTELVRSVKVPVTAKFRTGWDDSNINALEVARVCEEAGLAFIAIHGRTRAQGYSGIADWETIGNVKAKVGIPVIGNGDVISAEIGMQRLQAYGVDAIMIGRGVLRNPFLLEQCAAAWKGAPNRAASAAPRPEEYLRMVEELALMFEEHFTPHYAFIHAKKFLAWFASGFPGCHEFRKKVFTFRTPEELWTEARRFFTENTGRRDLKFMSEPFLMGGHG